MNVDSKFWVPGVDLSDLSAVTKKLEHIENKDIVELKTV